MLLAALLASLAASALADTPTALKTLPPTILPSGKASTLKAASSIKPATSLSTPKIRAIPSVPPKFAALSTLLNEKSAPHLKSQDSTLVTHGRSVPLVVRMITIKNTRQPTSEKISFSRESFSTSTTHDPVKIPSYDYIEPEEISNKLEEKFVDENKNRVVSDNLSIISTHQDKEITTTKIKGKGVEQNVTLVPQNTDDSFINALKENLRRGNDDYLDKLSGRDNLDKLSSPDNPNKLSGPDNLDNLSDPDIPEKLSDPDNPDKLSGRRRGNNIQIARPKRVDIRLRNYEKAKKDRDHARRLRNTKPSTKTRSKPQKTSKKRNRHIWDEKKSHTTKFTRYRAGFTTPSKYEIKPYKKPRKNERRHQGEKQPFRKHSKYRMHGNDLRDRYQSRGDMYHVQRRQDDLATIGPPPPLKSVEITMPADLASDLMLQRDVQPVTVDPAKRPHLHPKPHTTPSVATRPSVYDSPASSKLQKSLKKKDPTQIDYTSGVKEKPVARQGHSLTTGSAFERESIKKQKKLERFVKFINKNRKLLQQFIREKKASKMAEKNAYFRGGVKVAVRQPVHAHQLDLSPGRGGQIEALRSKGRICQRNVMIPEGPKYNSLGMTYMPAFKRSKGGPDYPATKQPHFLIPICCNCCKKSVLGCQ